MRRLVPAFLLLCFLRTVPVAAMTATCGDLLLAESLALAAHGSQRYGPVPFAAHLYHVQSILQQFGFDPNGNPDREIFVVAWLHDIVEDTPVSLATVAKLFGPRVARSVHALTLDPALPRRQALGRCLASMERDPIAVVVKLADRIANVTVCRDAHGDDDSSCYAEYRREWEFLREPFQRLARGRRAQWMWHTLDRLHEP